MSRATLVRQILSTTLDLLVRQHAQDMLDAVPGQHGILPACEVGILSRIPRVLCIFQDARDRIIPHDEGEVGVGALVAYEPAAVGEMGVEDFSDAVDFVVVAFAGRREGLGVEDVEPGEVGCLVRKDGDIMESHTYHAAWPK